MKQQILSVSELTSKIKHSIESKFPFVWVAGEISNFKRAASGHIYFTLKDDRSQISAVIFRGQSRLVKFNLANGLAITGLGRLSLYEPRGTYQIIFEHLEKTGVGDLMIAFEALKDQLSKEGLFDDIHKKALPFLPKRIGVITSLTGAVIRDIIKVTHRRYPTMEMDIAPSSVQGKDAEREIIAAIALMNRVQRADVIIIARGGGAFEDMAAFNLESVARAIYASQIPIISAVGHETDFTIADFVADLRAPTPSAAAELAVPNKNELVVALNDLTRKLTRGMTLGISKRREQLKALSERVTHPALRIQTMRLSVDSFLNRLENEMMRRLSRNAEKISWWRDRLKGVPLQGRIYDQKRNVEKTAQSLQLEMRRLLAEKKERFKHLNEKLKTLAPEETLKRGYSIVIKKDDSKVLSDANQAKRGDKLDILLYKGELFVTVDGKQIPEEN